MKYSIVIPVYNSQSTITKCLNSILMQTYTDFEVLIVNDGSNDRTIDICKEFVSLDSRFKYFTQDNKGVSAARNYGIVNARGDYILFLDSDDEFDDNYIEEFDRAVTMFPEYDNIWCGYSCVSESGAIAGHTVFALENDFLQMSLHQLSTFRVKALDAPLWNKVFKRSIINNNNIIMDEGLSLGEDILFNYKYLDFADSKILFINKPLYKYTLSKGNSLDTKFRLNLYQIYEKLDAEVFGYLQKWNASEETISEYCNSVYYSQERILRNTYHKHSTLSPIEKIKFNNAILRSKKFHYAIRNCNCYIHPLYRVAYKSKLWIFVMFVDKLVKLKQFLIK